MVWYGEPVIVKHGLLCCRITHHDSQPLVQHNTRWFTTTGPALHTMTHIHWLSITHHDSQPLAQHWLWIIVSYAEPVVDNHVVLSCAIGIFSLCVILSQWLWIIDGHAVPKVMIDGVKFWASGYEHSQPLVQHNTRWFTTTSSALHTKTHIRRLSITHHDSQPLEGCELWRVILSQWLSIMVCYTEPVDVNHGKFYGASSCE
jgi:hypothetical protein